MTITAYAQWDGTTAANNVDLNDIPLVENNMYPRHVNNAFREMMKQLKAESFGPSVPFTAASASGAASFAFAEDTDNGAHKVSIQGPASVASDKIATLQDITGTLYVTGGTDVSLADGGTGASLADPNADRIMFWDDSAGAVTWLVPSTGISISTTNLTIDSTVVARLETEDQTLTGGARVTSKSLGTVTSGTTTPDPGDRPLQHYTNGGAHTLAPGSNAGAYLLDIVNNGSAGAITTSGWTKKSGDSFTTTNGHKFRCHCSVGNEGSLLVVQALQ